jgi:hypothetical protein
MGRLLIEPECGESPGETLTHRGGGTQAHRVLYRRGGQSQALSPLLQKVPGNSPAGGNRMTGGALPGLFNQQ